MRKFAALPAALLATVAPGGSARLAELAALQAAALAPSTAAIDVRAVTATCRRCHRSFRC